MYTVFSPQTIVEIALDKPIKSLYKPMKQAYKAESFLQYQVVCLFHFINVEKEKTCDPLKMFLQPTFES